MFARFADVLLPVLENSNGIVETFLVKQRRFVVGNGIFSFIEVKRETEHDIESRLVEVMAARVAISRLLILAMIRVETRADGLNALRR